MIYKLRRSPHGGLVAMESLLQLVPRRRLEANDALAVRLIGGTQLTWGYWRQPLCFELYLDKRLRPWNISLHWR